MNDTDMPPIPQSQEYGPQVCTTVRLYLAVLNDLSPEQVGLLLEHVQDCPDCTAELRLLDSATQLVSAFAGSEPSEHADAAIRSALAAEAAPLLASPGMATSAATRQEAAPETVRPLSARRRIPRRLQPLRLIGSLVAAAVVLLALFSSLHFLGVIAPGAQAFALPANLSWSGYVVYHSQVEVDAKGMQYRVSSYHDLGTDRMHVETKMDGVLDVVAVGDASAMLGMDMIHHIAQWGADAWSMNDSPFDLTTLRSDLDTKRATYLDKSTFDGQDVYRIRYSDGLVLLLDMQYRPINLLHNVSGHSKGEPIYETFRLLSLSQVPAHMWDMSVPQGFRMGTLPAKP